MEAEDSDVLYIGEDQTGAEDNPVEQEPHEYDEDGEPAVELGDDEYVVRDEEDASELIPHEDEQRIADEKSAGKEETIVVDEWDNEDVASITDEEDRTKTEDGKDMLDPEESEKAMLNMPPLKTIMGDMIHLRRNRRLSVYPVTVADLNSTVIQNILNSDGCEEAKMQFVRPSDDSKVWTGFLSLTFVTSKNATQSIDSLKSLREDLTVKLDPNPDTSLENFIKEHRKGGGAWPSHWADKLVLVRNIPADTKPEDLRTLFADAEEIVVAKESPSTWSWSTKRHDPSARAMGFAYVLFETAETAQQVAADMANGIEFNDKPLGVHLYREPVTTIPRSLLYLRRRRLVIKHMEKLLSKLERSKMDPEYKLSPTVESRLEACKTLIEKDDTIRNELKLPTPTFEDFRNMRGFKPISAAEAERTLCILGVIPKTAKKAANVAGARRDRDKNRATAASNAKKVVRNNKPRGGGGGGGGGAAQNNKPRGGGMAFNYRRSPPRNTRRSPPRQRNDWGSNNRRGFSGRGRDVGSRGFNQGTGGSGMGVVNPLAAFMMQQNMGLLGAGGILNPLMMGGGSMGNGGLSSQALSGGGGSLEPPPKLLRLDETGSFRTERDYDRRGVDRHDNRGHFLDRGRPRSRSPQDYRSQRPAMNFPAASRYNEPERPAHVYGEGSHGGLGPARNDDINLLMNLSKMLSQKMEQKRQQGFDRF